MSAQLIYNMKCEEMLKIQRFTKTDIYPDFFRFLCSKSLW